MNTLIRQYLPILFSIVLSIAFTSARASHIVGGEVTYIYKGDTTVGSIIKHKYEVSLCLYEDCQNGQPEAIMQDNPAFLSVYDGTGIVFSIDSVNYSSLVTIPVLGAPSPCGSRPLPYTTCLIKKTFVKTYYLPDNTSGYVVAYQRCCRNNAIVNIVAPGDNGATYFCNIPAAPVMNTSAVFKDYPPQIICYGLPLFYDNSATDADGDSLSYAFSAAVYGASDASIKPIPLPPPYDSVIYTAPYSSQVPFTGSPAITIDPVTGVITGTPDLRGRYLVTVSCYEWRAGVLINTMTREYQFIVHDCTASDYEPIAGIDTTIMVGDSVFFNASGGHDYSWTPATYLSNHTIGNPIGYFPAAGHFTYTLHALSDSGCSGTKTRTVHVLMYSAFTTPNGFTPNGDGLNDYLKPLRVLDATLSTFKVFNRNGNLVYEGGPNDGGWDGRYKGVSQDFGTYFWVITYQDNKKVTRTVGGNVTLIR